MAPESVEPAPDPSEPDEVDYLLSRLQTEGVTPSQAFGAGQWSRGPWEPPTPEDLQGQLPYKVLDLVGRGGMGAVYRGWQSSLERYVAIKILPPDADHGNERFTERFKQEAKTMAKFQHPGIVSIHDAGETRDGMLYIVMEFIEGIDVSQMLQAQGKLPPAYALAITAHVCDALQYAHSHGVIHRDIKPANVMMNHEGEVKVADFGLARSAGPEEGGMTKSNLAVGTPDYVAPEALIKGIKLDARADLYAMGVMLYTMLTGQVPRGMFELPSVVTNGETDERFDAIVAKAMEPDREKRYQTAFEIRQDLDVILTTPKLEAHGPSSIAIPKHELAVVQRKMVAQKPVVRRPGRPTQRVREVVTYVPEPEKKSRLPVFAAVAILPLLAVGGYFGWRKFATHPSPAATAGAPANDSADSKARAPADALLFGGHRYKLIRSDVAWTDARSLAIAMGGHLATLTTREENEWVGKTFVENLPEERLIHIGGFKSTGENSQWEWVTGEPWSFEIWEGNRKPDRSSEARGVEYMNFENGGPHWAAKWNTVASGGRIMGFLVEWDTDQVERALTSSKPAPADALLFGGHRYKFFYGQMSWNTAHQQALSMGGHLVSITSESEDAWVRKAFADTLPKGRLLFTGGIKAAGTGSSFRWSNGEPWSYEHWERGETSKANSRSSMAVYLNDPQGAGAWSAAWEPSFTVIGYEGGNRIHGFLVEWDTDQVESPMASAPKRSDETVPVAPVDLLAAVDVKRDPIIGRLERKPEGLVAQDLMLQFDQAAPDEYDLEAEFTVISGIREIELILPLPTNVIVWIMGHGPETEDPTFFGFGPSFDGRSSDSVKRVKPSTILPRLKLGQRYRFVVEVRKDSLRALLDGQEITAWSGDLRQLTIKGWPLASRIRSQWHPGLVVNKSRAVLHKAELRPRGATVNKLAEIDAQFKEAYERDVTRSSAGKAVADLDKLYATALDRSLAKAQKDGKRADVDALQSEQKRLKEGLPMPTTDPINIVNSLAGLRDTYRKTMAPLIQKRDAAAEPIHTRHDQALAALQADLTQKGEIGTARSIQDFRDALQQQRRPVAAVPVIAAMAPAPAPAPPPNTTLAMAPSKPPEAKPKKEDKPKKEAALPGLPPEALQEAVPKPFTPTQAIEWALSLGGSAKIKKGSVESEIVNLGKPPKGNFVLTSLKIGGKQPLHVVSLAALSQLSDLQELILDDNLITDAGLAFLPRLPKLTRLSLQSCTITDAGLAHLTKQNALTSLNLSSNPINGSGLRGITDLQTLTTLELGGTSLADENVSALSAFTALHTLNLAGRSPLMATDLSSLANLKSLKRLYLGQAATDSSVQSLGALLQLNMLDLNRAPISDAALERIGSMKGLRELNFYSCPNLTDFGFARLQVLKGLTKLNVARTRLTDSQFIELSTKLVEITEIDVAADGMTDQGLAGLANMRKLYTLQIHARMCTDAGIAHVRRVATLRNLGITQRETLSPARFEALKRGLPNYQW